MLTKLHHMMKKYAFEYEKVILQGGLSVRKNVGIRRVNTYQQTFIGDILG